ncbi:unnamed protein product [Spirodela intermedia]|uniref:Uncharacterized protein n=1 Tax=Spirodela intermedia TaxID=51605 RepID=A0A7I8IHZ5_SPIIN|nr:unnamed protein product [Spirodela intermedia]CAA6657414.1 unnamed protein product [Spirodela intermedia]
MLRQQGAWLRRKPDDMWRSTGIVALRDRGLRALPREVLEVDKFIRTLDLTNNKIAMIPMEISKLFNMQRLPGDIHSLKVLTLDANKLRTLPDELGFLVRLEQLSVAGNMLTSLPETLGNLKNLLILSVSNNNLKYLPQSIGSCLALEEVRANDNSIEDLPPSICQLIHLKSLSLNNNRLHKLPPMLLRECKALQNISLHENPISMEQFQQTEGFQDFEARRKRKFDKVIDSNVMINSRGLDEGIDF